MMNKYSEASVIIEIILATIFLAASSVVMVGPQILVIVPACLLLGLWCVVRRSSWSFVLLGYPFTSGLTSAYIGYIEIRGYAQTLPFAISIGIGLAGCVVIAKGLFKLNNRNKLL